MAFAMFMHWDGVTPPEYNALMASLQLDTSPAAGSVLHLAAFTDGGIEVCDVWRTEEAFHSFLERRFLPAARELAIEGEPRYLLVPLHHLYAADPDTIDRIGVMSVPAAVASWV